ncbi:glycosidase [Pedobacter polaris]|uniref:Glycosidase n=1 Tax=Pedobacter polaris TaxID=2571273 RepID=A0A4U1CM82_9SPHI|nr:glycoside hydrolase family 130 protein [Pedobacter polaris]TKC08386.1 glycosidase [Pedobacter polaris]
MRIPIERKHVKVYPDSKRVIARFFFNGEERAKDVITKVLTLSNEQVFSIISPLLQEYSKRHRNITKILSRHCKKLKSLFETMDIDYHELETHRKLLIGSYFTHEYSIESAAFFNPSIVEDPDQTDLEEGEKRLIISFRAVGEGHISSIVFRRALIDRQNNITVIPVGDYIDEAEVIRNATYNKKLFLAKGLMSLIDKEVLDKLDEQLDEQFDYATLKKIIGEAQALSTDPEKDVEFEKVLWLSDSYYEIIFSMDTDISDRVIFPISEFERKGIEDARFTKFTHDDGSFAYYATYTAYDGHIIIPKLLKTKDFYDFTVGPLFGDGAQNKNLALFPRKINGKYAMLSRIDGINNYIMYSDKINIWENPVKFQEPKYSWEFVQLGNCGSPIETEDGWLVVTHAVGPMRRYCLSACLLDLDDPSIEIGRLSEPLLIPNPDEREGYVPNVVYSCGSIINNGQLIIPYGLSDYSSSFATVDLKALLDRLKNSTD